jgi:hypothetical protein
MSVSLTEPQVRDRSKTVTRRLGWLVLKPGDRLTLCRKVMGRRKGEPLVRLCDVEVVSVRREWLGLITEADVRREGFPDMTPEQFVEFFCRTHKGCTRATVVTRIEWRYVEVRCCPECGGSGTFPADPGGDARRAFHLSRCSRLGEFAPAPIEGGPC